ncbi:hypothetical protein [Cryobacterium suzukii]|nr:hypothetical protein [Cryobacterium suzukii]
MGNQLGRFLLRGATVERAVSTLFSRELFRVVLARLHPTITLARK